MSGGERGSRVVDADVIDAGVPQPHRDVARAFAGRDRVPSAQHFERHVPEP